MKALGFVKEHENMNNEVKNFEEFHYSINPYKNEILKYLKTGETIAVTMNIIKSLYNGDDNIIGGVVYFTDGNWIWTNYLIYYLEKYNIEINNEFVDYVLGKKSNEQKDNLNKQKAIKYLKEMKILV
ncbi:hypothetical protein [Flagellimonas onchidii]|uniref:hypothetical protein n=1 Tax=Flagellimonas onchidii TaxID=2562684 RepID=UPI0010A69AE4|nr:hypothetical protein [Allomuricauda onchidii]